MVAQRVVDFFEAVQVQQQQRYWQTVATLDSQGLLESRVQQTPIR